MLQAGTIIAHIFLFISLYFEIFLLVTFMQGKSAQKRMPEEPSVYPSVTIMVPCWNEAKTLAKTVLSLLSLEYPKDKLSIFIINDGSTDNTWEIMQQFKDNPAISLFQKENGGKHTALNLGISKATSDIVGCLDADSFVEKDALKQIVKRFENKEVFAVTPAIRINNPKNVLERVQAAEYVLSAFFRKSFSYINSIYITPGPFSFFRREVFSMVGPYHKAHNTEDLEIGLRLQKARLRVDNAENAYVYTTAPRTLKALLKQRVRWIHGFLENAKDYRNLFFKPSYGHVSMFILPTATLSIFTALFFSAFSLWSLGNELANKLVEFSVVGLGMTKAHPFHFDWFYVQTESIFLLSLILFVLTLGLLILAQYILDKKITFDRNIVYFILLYSLIAPLWLAASVYNTALARKTTWR